MVANSARDSIYVEYRDTCVHAHHALFCSRRLLDRVLAHSRPQWL